ncbi:hypothetical protein B0I35DRAFT_229591 [Stachybotrys elegans]|uniref:Uncharacterized protein n=1 Tax=Stachybotrys elegans TaxID=80388 RepID=A0A8K0WS27_9HYPO|nr:hypothetical protein B0I35DRAFT_229591 [Stachybotrys elegans]
MPAMPIPGIEPNCKYFRTSASVDHHDRTVPLQNNAGSPSRRTRLLNGHKRDPWVIQWHSCHSWWPVHRRLDAIRIIGLRYWLAEEHFQTNTTNAPNLRSSLLVSHGLTKEGAHGPGISITRSNTRPHKPPVEHMRGWFRLNLFLRRSTFPDSYRKRWGDMPTYRGGPCFLSPLLSHGFRNSGITLAISKNHPLRPRFYDIGSVVLDFGPGFSSSLTRDQGALRNPEHHPYLPRNQGQVSSIWSEANHINRQEPPKPLIECMVHALIRAKDRTPSLQP